MPGDELTQRRAFGSLADALTFIADAHEANPAAPFSAQVLGGSSRFPDRARRYRVVLTTAVGAKTPA